MPSQRLAIDLDSLDLETFMGEARALIARHDPAMLAYISGSSPQYSPR